LHGEPAPVGAGSFFLGNISLDIWDRLGYIAFGGIHMNTPIDIAAVLRDRAVTAHFQPLVSIKKQAVLGYEALCRGVMNGGGAFIPPGLLFSLVGKDLNSRLELDRLCRERALELFHPLYQRERGVILSINLDVAVLDSGVVGSNYLLNQVKRWGVNPNNVIIEIIESNVVNTEALVAFIQTYREHGFLIALDDVGTGHSNLERIALIQPDVIKLDRSLITCIDRAFLKQEITRSLIRLGQKVGAMVVGEGVEREEEAVFLLEHGVDVQQGFYFGRPSPLEPSHGSSETGGRLRAVAERFKRHVLDKISAKKALYLAYDRLVGAIATDLAAVGPAGFDRTLADWLARHDDLECLYVLDERGIQASDTICNPYKLSENKRFIYQPAQRGADHSLKDYFLPISAGLSKYTTESYISLASGNLCTTIATRLERGGAAYVLCVDISREM